MKTLSDLQDDATALGGLIDGLDALWFSDQSNARNAIIPVLEAAKSLADQLSSDLDITNAQNLDFTTYLKRAPKVEPEAKEAQTNPVYYCHRPETIDIALYQIEALARMGIAATDSNSGMDVGENSSLYEQIAGLALEAGEMAEKLPKQAKA